MLCSELIDNANLHLILIFFLLLWHLRAIYCHNNQLPQPILILSWSSPLFTLNLDASFVILSFYRCLGRFLGLLVSGFQLVANPIRPSDLHTCPIHPSLLLLRIPIMFVSPYSSFINSWFDLIQTPLKCSFLGQISF